MAKLALIICMIATSLALTNAISIQTDCWMKTQVDGVLAMNSASAAVVTSAKNLLSAFYHQAFAQTQGNGVIATAWNKNAAWQYTYGHLANTTQTASTMNALGANYATQVPTATNYCDVGTAALNIVSNAATANTINAAQKAEFVTFIELSYDIFRDNACTIWGIVAGANSATVASLNAALTCTQRNILAAITGCYVNLC